MRQFSRHFCFVSMRWAFIESPIRMRSMCAPVNRVCVYSESVVCMTFKMCYEPRWCFRPQKCANFKTLTLHNIALRLSRLNFFETESPCDTISYCKTHEHQTKSCLLLVFIDLIRIEFQKLMCTFFLLFFSHFLFYPIQIEIRTLISTHSTVNSKSKR